MSAPVSALVQGEHSNLDTRELQKLFTREILQESEQLRRHKSTCGQGRKHINVWHTCTTINLSVLCVVQMSECFRKYVTFYLSYLFLLASYPFGLFVCLLSFFYLFSLFSVFYSFVRSFVLSFSFLNPYL